MGKAFILTFFLSSIISFNCFEEAALAQELLSPSKSGDAAQRIVQDLEVAAKQVQRLGEQKGVESDKLQTEERGQLLTKIERLSEELKGIYGPDDRKNFNDPQMSQFQRYATSATAILVRRNKLISAGDGSYNLPTKGAGLCSPTQIAELGGTVEERFWDEPAPGFCSGFKVGPDLIATAGHCIISDQACTGNGTKEFPGTSFIFGFRKQTESDKPEMNIAQSRIYHCTAIVADGAYGGEDRNDWRVVKVDRHIDAPTVNIHGASSPKIAEGTRLTVIGYPMGLPVKVADNASVREVNDPYFVADLDTYGGNSGSLVLNSDLLEAGELFAEGILVRGDTDFVRTQPCRISRRCAQEGCRGEDVTLAKELESALQK